MAWLGIVLAVIIVLMIIISARNNGHLRRLQRSRPELSKSQYVQQLNDKGYDAPLVSAVYDTIRFYVPKWFSPYPGDDLVKTYRIATGDIDRFVRDLLRANDHVLPPEEVMLDIYHKHNERVSAVYLLDIISHSVPGKEEEPSR